MGKVYGLTALKPGASETSSDPADFTINTEYNTPKTAVCQIGQVTLAEVPPVEYIVDVTHNLGYKPQFFAWFNPESSARWQRIPGRVLIAGPSSAIAGCEHLDVNTVRMKFYTTILYDTGILPETVNYKIRIFADPEIGAWT